MIMYPPADEKGVNTVVEIVTACAAPGATAGVMLNDNGEAVRPVTTGTETLQAAEVVVPLVRVALTLEVVLAPTATVALDGFQATA